MAAGVAVMKSHSDHAKMGTFTGGNGSDPAKFRPSSGLIDSGVGGLFGGGEERRNQTEESLRQAIEFLLLAYVVDFIVTRADANIHHLEPEIHNKQRKNFRNNFLQADPSGLAEWAAVINHQPARYASSMKIMPTIENCNLLVFSEQTILANNTYLRISFRFHPIFQFQIFTYGLLHHQHQLSHTPQHDPQANRQLFPLRSVQSHAPLLTDSAHFRACPKSLLGD
ncbi:exodeoxyribonuclease III Xth [Striga asiatica]|uniref:Exodeoxyribonuclease III Xth n=1 Tax=Striga asiatica TaxID=4170 RepID=A0A5A7PGC5_STRAF|nr:exodeoxyribonuclease III Xth [Striga asiatica]